MEDILTLDGPTSSGKNSVGFLLAQKLNYQYIDTGMAYRAGCLYILKQNISIEDKEKILDVFRNLDIQFKNTDGKWKVYSFGEDVTNTLHSSQISKLVPIVAAIPEVREIMKSTQRKMGTSGKIVMSGRDIGSEIFPEAKYKFFLTANTQVRAKRRFEQLKKTNPQITFEQVLQDMIERDKTDSEREVSPMRIPKDAIVIDNSNLTVEQTVEKMLKHIR